MDTTTRGRPVARPQGGLLERTYLWEIGRGLGVTLRHFFVNVFTRRMTVTTQYPEEKVAYPPRFRGAHRLLARPDGSLRCVACYCCATACPAECIHIEAAEYPAGSPQAPFEKYPARFVIDELRCVFCGYCQEACPCDAIRLDTGAHVPPSLTRDALVWDEKKLSATPGADGTFETSNPRG